ncbi:MAG: ABC transporter substrate-binding protein [Solirubrobacteraceae bacterium]
MNQRSTRTYRIYVAAGASALVLALAGCGEIQNTITPKAGSANQVSVELTGRPNADYVGLYAAQALGYFKQTDMDVTFQTPKRGQDPLTMLHNSQVLIAISSEPTVFLRRNEEMPVVGVAALVRRPLSQIRVRIVKGRAHKGGSSRRGATKTATTTDAGAGKVGTGTGTTTTGGAGTTTTGTTTTGTTTTTTMPTPSQVPSASSWPPALRQLLGSAGAPTYNGLVVAVRKGTIVDDAPVIRRFVQAVARGYRAVRRDPRAGVQDLIAADPTLARHRRQLLATVRATLPYFFPATGNRWGWQSEAEWNAFGTWMRAHGVIGNPNAITDASTNELLQGEGV